MAFAAELFNFCRETFARLPFYNEQTTMAFDAEHFNLCYETFARLPFYNERQWILLRNFATSVMKLLRDWLFTANDNGCCCGTLQLLL